MPTRMLPRYNAAGLPLTLELRFDLVQLRRHGLFLPTDSWVEEGATATYVPAADLEDLFRLATSSADLLATCMSPIPAPVLRSFYREKAAGQGWIDHHGRIKCAVVIHISDHSGLGRIADADLKFCTQSLWIFKLLYKHRTAMHPLKHLALMTLLSVEIRDLEAYWKFNNFPTGYTPATRKCSTSASVPTLSQLDRRRERFLDQVKEVLPRHAQDYMWLYKHDYPWLKEAISQLPRPSKTAKERVAWGERDSLYAAQVRDYAALLYQSNVQSRISATRLGMATGKQALIQKFPAKLPLTTQTIRMLEETVDAFQCRRVRRIVQECQARGEVPTRWRILRDAGLATPLTPAVENEVAALLSMRAAR